MIANFGCHANFIFSKEERERISFNAWTRYYIVFAHFFLSTLSKSFTFLTIF